MLLPEATRHKICLYGETGVGRRSLIVSGSRRYTPASRSATSAISPYGLHIWQVEIERPMGRIALIDVYYGDAGCVTTPQYSDGASILMFVYSIESVTSYNSILKQLTELRTQQSSTAQPRYARRPVVWVIGTHLDRASSTRAVGTDNVRQMCAQFEFVHVEVAATSQDDVVSKVWNRAADYLVLADIEKSRQSEAVAAVDLSNRRLHSATRAATCQC